MQKVNSMYVAHTKTWYIETDMNSLVPKYLYYLIKHTERTNKIEIKRVVLLKDESHPINDIEKLRKIKDWSELNENE